MDWLDLLEVQGTLKSLLQHHSSKASILCCSAFLTVQLSHPYMTTGKTIALIRWTFVGKVMSLLFTYAYLYTDTDTQTHTHTHVYMYTFISQLLYPFTQPSEHLGCLHVLAIAKCCNEYWTTCVFLNYGFLSTCPVTKHIAQLVKILPAIQETWFDSWVGKIHWRRNRLPTPIFLGFPVAQLVKNPPTIGETWV